jgi:hypothetical protein
MNINARLHDNHLGLIWEAAGNPTTIMESLNAAREILHKTYWGLSTLHPLRDELRELYLRCAEYIDEFEARHWENQAEVK